MSIFSGGVFGHRQSVDVLDASTPTGIGNYSIPGTYRRRLLVDNFGNVMNAMGAMGPTGQPVHVLSGLAGSIPFIKNTAIGHAAVRAMGPTGLPVHMLPTPSRTSLWGQPVVPPGPCKSKTCARGLGFADGSRQRALATSRTYEDPNIRSIVIHGAPQNRVRVALHGGPDGIGRY